MPGLTADTCGELLTGVGREVFQRSAFLGSGGDLSVTAAPELERRIAALVSSGQEDVSFSQTQARLREWLNRRRVNKSVGQIPKLEQELSQVEEQAEALSALCGEIARLEETVRTLERERADALSRLRRSRLAAQAHLDPLLMAAVRFTPLGYEAYGARRWLRIGTKSGRRFGSSVKNTYKIGEEFIT